MLHLDIVRHFPAIDHAFLRDRLGQVIRDDESLALCAQIVASGDGVLDQEYEMVWFPGDDLWPRAGRVVCRSAT